MDGYLYHDQLARLKIWLYHLLLEICKYHHHNVNMIHVGTFWLRVMYVNLSERTSTFHNGSMYCFLASVHSTWHDVGDSRFWIVYDMYSVSVANNFVHCQTAIDYGYHTFGELARLIYCLLQKIKQSSSLPLVEQWDDYVLPNHSKFRPDADGEFLAGTRVLAALNKIGSSYLKREFQCDARRILEEFTTPVLSTVAARSKIGQGLSCFCPAIIIGGDDHTPLHLLVFSSMVFWIADGSRAVKSRLARLNTSPLFRSNDSWSGLRRGAALT